MKDQLLRILFILCIFAINSALAKGLKFKARDKFELNYVIDKAKTKSSNFIILVHDKGAMNMDHDLTKKTKYSKQNHYFKNLSSTLTSQGFNVVRYNKRSFELIAKAKKDKKFFESKTFKKIQADTYRYYIYDLIDLSKKIKKTHKNSKLFLLGLGQGTKISLHAHSMEKDLFSGMTLIGFTSQNSLLNFYEEHNQQLNSIFHSFDRDGNKRISSSEARNFAKRYDLVNRFKIVDLDKDGLLSKKEFAGLNYISFTNLIGTLKNLSRSENRFPILYPIIEKSNIPLIFIHGIKDKSSNIKEVSSLNILNELKWKNKNLNFYFLKGLGHILDKVEKESDIRIDLPDDKALELVGKRTKEKLLR